MTPENWDDEENSSSVFENAPPIVPPPLPPVRTPTPGVTIGPERDVPEAGVSAGPLIDSYEPQPLNLDALYGPMSDEEPPSEDVPPVLVDKVVSDSSPLAGAIGGLLGVAALGGIWWATTRGADPLIPASQAASPEATWDEFRVLVEQDVFVDSILRSLWHFGLALLVGGIIGGLVGTVAGSLDLARAFLRPIVGLFRWLSPALVFVVALLRWGIDDKSIWIPAAVGTAAAVAWATTAAISDARRSLSKNQAERLVSGLRAALPLTWALVYFAELLASNETIGGQVLQARSIARPDTIFVYLIVATLMALIIDLGLRIVQHSVRDH